LRHARSFLERGYNALVFPEGTRSLSGEMAEFKPIIGYLALTCRVGILPIYVYGTYEAMPKGSNLIKSRNIGTRIGRYLSFEELEGMTKGMARAEAYRLIAALTRHQVENLRDGTRHAFDAKALRKRWKSERRAATLEREEQGTIEPISTTGD
jgi:long-chain acyl-CoA synthetase